ncbi:MAG: hypothetical protein KAS19_02125 [Anaerolineales bacterium]|nr:hypothetical protein [Anaerolineales bacterium]
MNRDIVNDHDVIEVIPPTAVSGDGDTFGSAVDTADYELGVMFAIALSSFTDGEYDITVQDSDDGSTDWQDVDAEELQNTPATADAASGNNRLSKVGAFSTRRYQRVRVTASSVTTGATVTGVCVEAAELKPTPLP